MDIDDIDIQNLDLNYKDLDESILKNIKWGTLLDGTSKTLGVINQAIPIIYQVKPIIGNMKTISKIVTNLSDNQDNEKVVDNKPTTNENKPIFYI